MRRRPPRTTRTDTLFPYTTLFRSVSGAVTFDIESSYRVDIASTGNAMTKLLEITGGRAAPIDKIKIVYTYDSRPGQIELSRSGSIAVSWDDERSEERRVGKECVSKCRSRWSRSH